MSGENAHTHMANSEMSYVLWHGARQKVMSIPTAVPNWKQRAGGPKNHRNSLYWHFTLRKYKNPVNWNIPCYRENQILIARDVLTVSRNWSSADVSSSRTGGRNVVWNVQWSLLERIHRHVNNLCRICYTAPSGIIWLAPHVSPYLWKVQNACRISPLSLEVHQYMKAQN